MMKIALFGATGKTGSEFLKLALEEGYSVKALARNPAKLGSLAEEVEVIKGDVLNYSSVQQCVAGTDVVVSLFGHVKGSPKELQTSGTSNIVMAMKKSGAKKVISLSGGGLPFEKDRPKLPDHIIRFVMKLTVPKILNDAKKHAEVLRNSGLKWMIVRGPMLTDDPAKGNYKVSWVGVDSGIKISRADLADFILKQVESDEYVGQMPFVSY